MSQSARQKAINGFRAGKFDILVATDIAARGIDVAEISHVINFDMPDTVDAYTHRIGRTGRHYETGQAFTFAVPEDEVLVRDIERLLKKPIERRRMPGFDYSGFDPDRPPQQNGSQGLQRNGGNGRRPQSRSRNSGQGGGSKSGSQRGRNRRRQAYAGQGNSR
jgi:ATP-dependent RNA helicase RhlE